MYTKFVLIGGVPIGIAYVCFSGVSAYTVISAIFVLLPVLWMVVKFIGNLKFDDPETKLDMRMKPACVHGYQHGDDGDEDITEELRRKFEFGITELMYDPTSTNSIVNFETVKMNTECIFAKTSKLWGSCDYTYQLTLEENVKRSIPMFMKFSLVCAKRGLDGFVFELPEGTSCNSQDDIQDCNRSLEQFAEGVCRVLTVLSDYDPTGYHCMNKSFISKRGWCFEFNRETYFITTFSSCYPESHSRYAFGAKGGFILFQPEISFALHNIPDDTPETNWENPKTVRDRIRVAFRENGREYLIRDTVVYPVAHDIVKPVAIHDPVVEWWKMNESENTEKLTPKCPFLH